MAAGKTRNGSNERLTLNKKEKRPTNNNAEQENFLPRARTPKRLP